MLWRTFLSNGSVLAVFLCSSHCMVQVARDVALASHTLILLPEGMAPVKGRLMSNCSMAKHLLCCHF
uniref:Putative secreted protein n=1 Tax=Amblyomma cajennense TaxID=34607 RepID=A0A023FDA7_AMBCJ